MSFTRRARVQALAKINLDLRVLGKRDDGYHELRTIFQTISLADTLDIAFTPARKTSVDLDDALGIPDNLVVRAAHRALDAMRATGRVEMRLDKRIPMGAGLGGGSSDAAAVLLALPVLAGRSLPLSTAWAIAQELGSDITFFLLGGRAAGIGRGTELFPLPDDSLRRGPLHGLLVAPNVHVSTAEAYRGLAAGLTSGVHPNKIVNFQLQAWGQGCVEAPANDFEPAVFAKHPRLAQIKKKLQQAGASPAMMTGSGSALFGLFRTRSEADKAVSPLARLPERPRQYRMTLVSRVRYQQLWWRSLKEHISERTWPPQSRYAK